MNNNCDHARFYEDGWKVCPRCDEKISNDKTTMNEDTKSPEMQKILDEVSMNIFGRSRSLARAGNSCVSCGKPATTFRNEISRKEFGISGLCQKCQDKVFGV